MAERPSGTTGVSLLSPLTWKSRQVYTHKGMRRGGGGESGARVGVNYKEEKEKE
jgi:hypothetical protein